MVGVGLLVVSPSGLGMSRHEGTNKYKGTRLEVDGSGCEQAKAGASGHSLPFLTHQTPSILLSISLKMQVEW